MNACCVPQPPRLALRLRSSLARCVPRKWRHRVPIAYGDDDFQRVQLYLPAARTFPVVVCIYGCFWHCRYDQRWSPIGRMLQEHGFGAVVMRHRLWPPHPWPAQIEDVAATLAWAQAHLEDFGGRPDRVALLGHSSGAQLALLVSLDRSILRSRGVDPGLVRAIVALGPPTDLVPRGDGASFGDELVMGGGAGVFARDVAVLREASPRTHVRPAMPPIQLVIGQHDLPSLARDVELFRSQCEASGGRIDLVRASGRDHMGLVTALVDDAPVRKELLRFLHDELR